MLWHAWADGTISRPNFPQNKNLKALKPPKQIRESLNEQETLNERRLWLCIWKNVYPCGRWLQL